MLSVELARHHPVSLRASLSCAPGELLAIVGASGAGKSTLLKSIAGLLPGAAGTIKVGNSLWLDTAAGVDVAPHLRRVGFVFQSYALFPHLTVLENVAAAAGGGRDALAAARSMIASMRMSALEGRRPAQLSGGEQQRVGLARALVRKPEVLLLDEPFSAVDQMTRESLYEEIADLRAQLSMPTVLVTHSISEAQRLADSVVVLHRGRTLQTGTPETVYRHPSEPDVARLMGHLNVFTAAVRRSEGNDGLDWNGVFLRTSATLADPGRIAFCVAADDVLLRDPALDSVANTFDATVERVFSAGAGIIVHARACNGKRLVMAAPRRILARPGATAGAKIALQVLPNSIHVMPTAAPTAEGPAARR